MLEEYEQAIVGSAATAVRVVATSATRDASNAAEFASGVRRILGVDPEVVSGAAEARLSFSGATAELGRGTRPGRPGRSGWSGSPGNGGEPDQPAPPFLVVDIGGGSTEFVLGGPEAAAGGNISAISVDVGSVRLTERHLHDDPPAAEQIVAATRDLDAALTAVAESIPVASANTLVGLAGSVTTLTAVALNLTEYDPARVHHARLSAARVHEVTASLLGMDREHRAAIRVIHPGRVDVIGAGALILDRIMQRFGFSEMVASEHDILDGIAWSIVSGAAGVPEPR